MRASAAILVTAATAQRRRTVSGLNIWDLHDRGEEIEWEIPPYFRKTANKTRSQSPHRIPLVGWAAKAVKDLQRLTNGDWLFPAGPTDDGKGAMFEHVSPDWISKIMQWMPRVEFSPHRWRKALSTYGSEHLGWPKDEEKIILDHMEGYDSGDVTGQHYNLDPRMQKKRTMLRAWQEFLDKCEAETIAREPWLRDIELIREKVYRARYGDEAWKRAIERSKKDGKLPWSTKAA